MKTIQWIITAICICVACTVNAQSLTNDQKIEEVYGASFFNNKPELRNNFTHLLDERISYVLEPQTPNEKYPRLSQMPLNNKINSSLTYDVLFDANTFNPLKYNLSFFSNQIQVYRIDGSDYILVIQPQ